MIELTKNVDPDEVIQQLYKRTQMRTTFSIIMLALVKGEPRLLSLKQALRVYVEHRFEVVRRRSEFELARAKKRAHILEGIRTAISNLDEVIELIRRAHTAETAAKRLRQRFKLSVAQAQAVLDLPLRRLASLERKKIEEEYKALKATIRTLQALLRSPKKIRMVVIEELEKLKETYGDARRTQIVRLGEGETQATVLTASDLTPDKTVWVSVTPDGQLSRAPEKKTPRLSGKAAPAEIVRVSTRDTLYLVNEQGESAAVAVHVIPETDKLDEGVHFAKVSPLSANHPIAALFSLPPKDQQAPDWYVVSVSRGGMIKKTALEELPGPSATTIPERSANEVPETVMTDLIADIRTVACLRSPNTNSADTRPGSPIATTICPSSIRICISITSVVAPSMQTPTVIS